MSEPEQAVKARRVRDVVVDAYIELICPMNDAFRVDIEAYARNLECAAAEFREFLRDHRSRRDVWLQVKRVKQNQCSVCRGEWEQLTEDGVTYCANCGAEVEDEE